MNHREFRSSDDVTLRYRFAGHGPVVIALHGFPDTWDTWQKLGADLEAAGFTFVALAMRGYAPSSIPKDRNYTVDRLASDIAELLDDLQCQKAFVIGHDWGASAAYAFSALYPQRVRAIVTLAIAPLAVAPGGWLERWARPHNIYLGFGALSDWWFRLRDFGEIERLYTLWSANWSVPFSQLQTVKDALKPPQRSRAAIDYYRLRRTGQNGSDVAVPIDVPALIIYGADEPAIRKAAFKRAMNVVGPGSKLVEIAGVGHWPHLEAPQRCLAEMKAFLSFEK